MKAAQGPREARPDDGLREAIHSLTRGKLDRVVASLLAMTAVYAI